MKNAVAPAMFISFACFAVMQSAEPPNDADIRRLIVGKWHEVNNLKVAGSSETYTTYRADGTLEFIYINVGNGQRSQMELSGAWKVSAGTIFQTFEKPLRPNFRDSNTRELAVLDINDKFMDCRHGTSKVIFRMDRITDTQGPKP
jgi:hypothetical protein